MAKKNTFDRELNGVNIQQRKTDGYINATAMCKAHLTRTGQRRDVSEWLSNKRTQQTLEHVARSTGIPVDLLVDIVLAGPNQCRGTYLHPRLATRFGMWVSDDFGLRVEDWVAEWMTTGSNPLTQADVERIEYRDNLKDQSRLRLTDQVKWHLSRIRRYTQGSQREIYFARVNDAINVAITGERAKTMRLRLSTILGKQVKGSELIRDYFPAMVLQRYIAVCEAAANLMRKEVPPLEAVQQAAEIVLPAGYEPTPIDFTTHIKLVRQKAS